MGFYMLHKNIQLPSYFSKAVLCKEILIFRGPLALKVQYAETNVTAMPNINLVMIIKS